MDARKKAGFVKACSKKRRRFSKGGAIRKIAGRKYFDDGGTVLQGPTSLTTNNAVNPNTGVMGTIGDALGLNNNFQASSANITPGTNTSQLNSAYTGAQGGLNNQGTLVAALQPQVPTAVANQNAVANSELNMLNGTGPNPALDLLHQQTAENIANQGSLMASQRGASANPGLIARLAATQGAATQQQAVGQGATNEANQVVNAQNNLANLSNNQISQTGQAVTGQNTAQQNEQSILQNANTATNNAAVGMQSNINNVNSQTAAGNQNMAGKILGGVGSAISSLTGGLFEKGGYVEDEHLRLAEMIAHAMKHVHRIRMAEGGALPSPNLGASRYMETGAAAGPNIEATQKLPPMEEDFADDVKNLTKEKPEAPSTVGAGGNWEGGGGMAGGPMDATSNMGAEGPMFAAKGGMMAQKICAGPHGSHVANYLADGGPVEAMVSEKEIYLNPEQVRRVMQEGANPLKIGKKIKASDVGQRARVKGDSLKNDSIPMTLEEGGVVLPRHITQGKKISREKAELFVHRAMARKKASA